MSESDGAALQFDQAEFSAPEARACALCRQAIVDRYFTINGGRTVCSGCADKLRAELAGGSGALRFWKALGLGGAGAVVGALLFYGIREATGYELGIVAIAVGVVVGKGVAKGAAGRRNLGYPFLAVLLTYFSIVLTYVPIMLEEWSKQPAPVNAISHVVITFLTIGFTLIAPLFVGFHAPLSLVITGIALYQAWKITRASSLVITGPMDLAPAAATPSPAMDASAR
jgi:hypothetical protein